MKRFKMPLAAVGGALLALLFDPVSGRRRRAQIGQRVPAFFRRRRSSKTLRGLDEALGRGEVVDERRRLAFPGPGGMPS